MADPNEAGGWVIDPQNPNRATYTDETGQTFEAFKEAPAPSQPQATPEAPKTRGAFQRLTDSFNEATQQGFPGWVARKWYDWTDYGINTLKERMPGQSDEWYESKADELIGKAQEGLRAEMAAKQAADPNWKPDESFWEAAGQIDRWGPWLAGQVLGSAGPESLVNPGATAAQRIGAQGIMGGLSDAVYQGLDQLDQVRKEFDVEQMLTSAAAGAGLQGTFEVPGFIKNLFKNRDVDTTPEAMPKGTTTPMSGMRLSPEDEAAYADLLDTGSVKDILNFFEGRNGFSVNPSDVVKWVQARDAGLDVGEGRATYVKPEGEDGLETQLAEEANRFMQAREAAPVEPVAAPRPEATPEARSAAVNAAVDHVNQIAGKWENAPSFEIRETFDDLPDLDPSAIGVTTPEGKIMINMKNVSDEAAARGVQPEEILSAVTFHEGLGHSGLTQKFGEELDNILENIYSSSNKFQKDVDDWIAKNPDAYADDVNPLARAAEEVLAEMSENGQISPSLLAKFRNWLKDFGRSVGFDLKYSDGEIRTILGMAHDAIVKGAGRDVRANGFRYSRPTSYDPEAAAQQRTRLNQIAEPELGVDEQLVNLNTGEAGPDVRIYETDEVAQMIAQRFGPEAANRYMKRTAGKGSQGPLQGGSRKSIAESEDPDRPYLGVGNIRSRENIEGILAENAPEPTKESWNDWIADASKVRTLVKAHKNLDEGSTPAQVLAAREAIVKSANRIAQLSRKAADGELTEREQYQLFAEMARNADMQDALAGVRSNAARIVNSFKISVETDAAFADAIRNMMKTTNNTVFSNPQHRQQLFQMVANAGNNPSVINKITKQAFRTNAEDFIFRVWYNMLLSSPATHSANFLGTAGNFIYDLLENTGAVVAGHAKGGAFRNIDRVRAREVGYRVWGALRALATADTWKNTRDALNTGQTGGQANSKTGGSHVYTGSNPVLGAVSGFVEAPTRALAGADEWWRNVLQLSNIYGLAVRNAGNKGLKGKQFWDEVDNLINSPTKEMIDATNDYTKVLQFMDKPSWIAQGIINLQTPKPGAGITERVGKGILKVAVPFVRTPDALIRTAIRRSGALSPLERENINGWKAGGAERDKVKARMIMGSALSFWLAAQAYKGNITGEGPADYKKKQEWLGSHQENSIKVGDEWISIAGLEPVSTNITGIATLVERLKSGEINDEEYAKSALALTQGIAAVLTENSYLQGFQNLMETNTNDPNKAATAATNFIANLASSATTPAIVRAYAQSQDPAVRDTTGDGSLSDRISGRIKSGWPDETGDLPQRYDVYGRPLERDIAGPNMLTRANTKPVSDDPAIQELERLAETTDKVVVGAPGKANIKVNGVQRRLTADEYQKYQYLSGYWIVESVRQEMETPEWAKMSDEEKIAVVKDIRNDMRQAARDLLFDPDDNEPDTEGLE